MAPTTRRPKGDGSIFRTDRGWRGYLTVDGQRKTFRGKTKREVAERMRVWRTQERPRATRNPRAMPTVQEFAERWLQRHALTVRDSTLEGYRRHLQRRILPAIGTLRLDAVRHTDLDRLLLAMLQTMSHSSTHEAKVVLTMLFDQAVLEEYLPSNPMATIRLPKATRTRIAPMPLDFVPQVLQAAKQRSWSEYLRRYLALHLGLRRSEILALAWGDFDEQAGTMTVRASLGRRADSEVRSLTKSGQTRTLQIGPDIVDLLRNVRTEQQTKAAHYVAAHPEAPPFNVHDLVFCTRTGRPITKGQDYREWRHTLQSAGLPPVRLHAARHMVATALISDGMDPVSVSKVLGHATPDFTLRTYVHKSSADAGDVAARVKAASRNALPNTEDAA